MTLAEAFEAHRDRLRAVAYRMLGSHADAEDVVQEAWLRLSRQEAGAIDNLGGWLTTVVGRISLDVLRSGRRRPEVSYDDGPEYAVTPDGTPAPEELAAIGDSVGVALLTVLDTLRPDERLAFVLHDVFAVPFAEVGPILGKSADATKMLASRARRKVQGAQQSASPDRRQREVVQAFLAAAREGRFERLLEVLHPEVKLTAHTPDGTYVVIGATEVATRARLAAAAPTATRPRTTASPRSWPAPRKAPRSPSSPSGSWATASRTSRRWRTRHDWRGWTCRTRGDAAGRRGLLPDNANIGAAAWTGGASLRTFDCGGSTGP